MNNRIGIMMKAKRLSCRKHDICQATAVLQRMVLDGVYLPVSKRAWRKMHPRSEIFQIEIVEDDKNDSKK